MQKHDAGTWALVNGECIAVLKKFTENRFDSVVTDPPYELGFMGKKWDATGIAYSVELWREVLRVLKPGGHLLAFGGTRTYHRMVCAIEDAGFEVRDSLHWMYGTGFPKSLNVGDGRGTALKPAHEPIVMARKPLIGTVAANVQEHGTGALNIDECRIGTETVGWGGGGRGAADDSTWNSGTTGLKKGEARPVEGRWPANVLLDESAAAELDAQSGTLQGRGNRGGTKASGLGYHGGVDDSGRLDPGSYGDSGGASRFFYVAKPSRKERDLGCGHLTPKTGGEATDREDDSVGTQNPRAGAGRTGGARNYHPTVKPVELMRYLVRLVTPPGGTVLDPFTGSGTTGCACVADSYRFLGIEREAEYFEICKARITQAEKDGV